ncbi:MAG TPA: signal peptidase II [Thiobacillaceae bacterium]|nr:signal peptidase II [Thiobacillaceae bacterium]
MSSPDLRTAGHGRNSLRWLWLSALTLVLDQLTKWAIMDNLVPYRDSIPLTGFFKLVHVHNTGAAFSLFADQPGWQKGFFMGVAIVAAGIILHLLRKTHGRPLFAGALALVLGGAIGNLIDRALYGHVIDFLLFYVGEWSFPAFNVADSAITLGAGLLILDAFRNPDGRPTQDRGQTP